MRFATIPLYNTATCPEVQKCLKDALRALRVACAAGFPPRPSEQRWRTSGLGKHYLWIVLTVPGFDGDVFQLEIGAQGARADYIPVDQVTAMWPCGTRKGGSLAKSARVYSALPCERRGGCHKFGTIQKGLVCCERLNVLFTARCLVPKAHGSLSKADNFTQGLQSTSTTFHRLSIG